MENKNLSIVPKIYDDLILSCSDLCKNPGDPVFLEFIIKNKFPHYLFLDLRRDFTKYLKTTENYSGTTLIISDFVIDGKSNEFSRIVLFSKITSYNSNLFLDNMVGIWFSFLTTKLKKHDISHTCRDYKIVCSDLTLINNGLVEYFSNIKKEVIEKKHFVIGFERLDFGKNVEIRKPIEVSPVVVKNEEESKLSKIKKMREDGCSYERISSVVNATPAWVKKHCEDNEIRPLQIEQLTLPGLVVPKKKTKYQPKSKVKKKPTFFQLHGEDIRKMRESGKGFYFISLKYGEDKIDAIVNYCNENGIKPKAIKELAKKYVKYSETEKHEIEKHAPEKMKTEIKIEVPVKINGKLKRGEGKKILKKHNSDIIELIKSGKTFEEIANIYGVTKFSVDRYIQSNRNIFGYIRSKRTIDDVPSYLKNMHSEILDMFESDLTYKEISKKLNVSLSSIEKYFRENNLKRNSNKSTDSDVVNKEETIVSVEVDSKKDEVPVKKGLFSSIKSWLFGEKVNSVEEKMREWKR